MQPSQDIRAEIDRLMKGFRDRDMAFFDAVSRQPGVLGIGSDPKEWLEGHERIREVFGGQMSGMPAFEFATRHVAAYERGDVGWGVVDGTWTFPKTQPLATRVTFVFEREEGGWKVVQFETTFAFPDEGVFRSADG